MTRRSAPRKNHDGNTRRHPDRRQSTHVRQSAWATVREEAQPEVFDEDGSL